jgi:AcrR family transcriptional regulator
LRDTQFLGNVADIMDESDSGGLRERKKLATRAALSRAALQLALEQGLHNVRVDAIAAAAGVSPRTYNNYFSSREEAICAIGVDRAERIGQALRARPADEALHDAIVHAIVGEVAGPEPEKKFIRMIVSDPALRGEFLKTNAALERPLAEAIAERIGADSECDMFPMVLAAAVSGANRAAMSHWLRTDDGAPLETVLREALSLIEPIAHNRGAAEC